MKKRFAVIGYPLGHTMSPFIHKRLFELSKTGGEYEAILTPPEKLKETVASLKSFEGFNVTIPHKTAIIPLMDELSVSAKTYGAINTVKNADGRLIGYSTDASGFSAALALENIPLKGRVLILGCGGVSRTIAIESALADCDITFAVLERNFTTATALCDEIHERFSRKAGFIKLDDIKENYDLIVNGTPVGMYPKADACPITDRQIALAKYVFDAVYNPEDTLLIKKAREQGKTAISGMSMLVMQAAKAQEHWYGAKFAPEDLKKLIADANTEMRRSFGE